ncbi:unnamed protein product [Microthlaspi erraticum]|uniref:CAAX prenyl protease 2/Lysostaphin resistance protein A-like domain-containing protein n=1 Tax=Microthlaspi erraticum TaxID=1685480 RepID=A0A6D2JQY3_9BRAS|nr:unnamed protein product [Microthlaspi erraticum]
MHFVFIGFQAAEALLKAIGTRWKLPWTAETIVKRMLPLVFLGVVLGLIFARSRNLLPSMLLHSLWNGFVLMGLMR